MAKTKGVSFTKELTLGVAKLSNLTLKKNEEEYLTGQFNETLKVIDKLGQLAIGNTQETSQVTGLNNVFREDQIDKERMLTQKNALSGVKISHRGYFVVDSIFDEK